MDSNDGAGRQQGPETQTQNWHTLDESTLQSDLGTGPSGLSAAEVQARLARTGPNLIADVPPPSNLGIFLRQFRSPFIYILLIAAAVTVFLGEYADAIVVGSVLLLNAIIGFIQERRAEISVRALMRLLAPHARAVREGREWDIESRDLVPGDLVLLESGSRIPADLRLVSAQSLMVDESLLTGESVPLRKHAEPLPPEVSLADRANMAYAGTIVTSGRGRGYVVATAGMTELGSIVSEIRGEERAATPLQHRLERLAGLIGLIVAGAAVLVFIIGLLRGESVAEMFLVAVALAVSAVPEGLPVAFTVTFALGVRRMARRNAITRRLPAVETLGSTTVIGSDKTGTLTENRMTVQAIWAGGEAFTVQRADRGDGAVLLGKRGLTFLPEHRPLYMTLLTGVLTNDAQVYRTEDGFESQGDPTEAGLLIVAARLGVEPEEVRENYPVHAEIPFEPDLQYSASIRRHDNQHLVFVKGAPERVISMCDHLLTDEGPRDLDTAVVQRAAGDLAAKGMRVLAMAYRVLPSPPSQPEEVNEPDGLTFLGFQGMLDPPRIGVREAIAGCREAGMRVLMITGDHAETAGAISREIGIAPAGAPVLTGTDIEPMDDATLRRRVREVAVYARVAPEQKLRIVRALQMSGETVAVTGDGVNDAPALRAADIGIAMGRGGTDVAREAADMVLADDDFVSIYAAVEEGRITFENLRKVTFYLLSTAVAEVLTILIALAVLWPLPYRATQILWLNLVTEGLQGVALAFERGEPGVLKRPPRSRKEGIISRVLWERTFIAGLVMTAGTLFLFRWELDQSGSLMKAQTVALTTMVLFQMFHVANVRSEHRSVFQLSPLSNRFLLIATAAAFIVHVVALYAPPTQFLLRVEPVGLESWLRMILVGLTIVVAIELHKLARRRRNSNEQQAPESGQESASH